MNRRLVCGDRIAVNDGDTIPRPDPPTLFGLFYDGKVNVIARSPTTGKSYAALAAATDAAKAGRVMWLDAEDSPRDVQPALSATRMQHPHPQRRT